MTPTPTTAAVSPPVVRSTAGARTIMAHLVTEPSTTAPHRCRFCIRRNVGLHPLLRASLLPERPADDLSRHSFAPHLDIECGADLGGGGGEIGGADGHTERGTHCATPHDVHFSVRGVDRISVPGKATPLE